ncbi:MAG: FAD:protein FMN transferase [Cytophagales bacterium]|nr:FAD:protein FMN transferase [Cytophagales bacterium]
MSKALALIFLLLTSIISAAQTNTGKSVALLMGSRFELVVIHHNAQIRKKAIGAGIAEIQRIEALISSWTADSETGKINYNAGRQPVRVSEELFKLVERTIKISDLTGGAFDISFNSLSPIWVFDGRSMNVPDSSVISASVKKINYKNIELNRENLTIYLKEQGMRIGFGAIGKGYAANRAKKVMLDHGIENGMVNAGGDLIAWGSQENEQPWQIGIADPAKDKAFIAWLSIRDMSVVTSGNYEKYVVINGKKYGHIINPKSGWPVEGIQSVTLVSPDAELSDALATSVFVLGIDEGLKLVNRLKNVECLIIDEQNKIRTSDKLELNYY